MDFRTRRQLAVILVVGLSALAIGFGFYRAFAPQPTCFDNRQNQKEEEVDCGGPCIPCLFKHQKPLEVFWARFVEVRENTYDVAAEIRNPNAKLAATSFEYILKMFDTAGVLVDSRRGTAFIYPAETMHIVEVGLTSGRVIRNVTLRIERERWAISESIAPNVVVGNREYGLESEDGGEKSVLKAIVVNNSVLDVPGIRVAVLAFDDRANLLGVHGTVIDTLRAGESRPVKFIWPSMFPRPVSSIVIEARSAVALPPHEP